MKEVYRDTLLAFLGGCLLLSVGHFLFFILGVITK